MISVIIPVFNLKNYISKCLKSIINQTYKDIEILIIDDGSNDDTCIICDKYAKQDCRIKILQTNHSGVSSARNLGLEVSKGEYIAFIDGDDWIDSNTFQTCLKYFNQEIDCVAYDYISEGGKKDSQFSENIYFIFSDLENKMEANTVWGKIYKSSIIKNNKLEFSKSLAIGEDALFNLEYMSLCKKMYFTNEVFYHYLFRKNSAINKFNKIKIQNICSGISLLEKFLTEHNNLDTAKKTHLRKEGSS